LLHARSLTKRYGRVTALADVSFSVRPGEVLGLIGPNGSGKTTLFECLGGVLPLDGGSIEKDGAPLGDGARAAALFYLPDQIVPWPSQTVGWAIDFTLGFFGGRSYLRAEVTKRFGLERLLDATIGSLSKGQRKRALLAIGLMMPQAILLADEPFDGLDLRQSRDVADALRSYASAGRTMFLSIHQIRDAARVCDRFILLSGGRVCGEGTLPELSAAAEARGSRADGDLEEVFLALT
jgi:ABC-type multidrug transport system ATPase subunit